MRGLLLDRHLKLALVPWLWLLFMFNSFPLMEDPFSSLNWASSFFRHLDKVPRQFFCWIRAFFQL